ncbi:hypothetical protein pipiens_008471 [Culex pipiens pipiens]|uniref:Odorant receptor n=1 Tax=Culex pipiens pipiens TaxID=38569 RepID=A0ABD1DL36_CULPP
MEALARSRLWSRCKSRATAYYRALTRDFNYSTDFFFGQEFLMAIAGARLNSTNVRIRRWWNAYRVRMLELEPGNSRQQDLMKKRFFWKFVQEEFGDCVQLHIEFLAMLNRIRPFLNATFLIVYYSTVMSLSSGAIYVSQMKSITVFSFITLYYCVWISFECATLSRAVSILTDTHESIGWAVYNLDWPEKLEWDDQFQEEYRSVRATMLNVMIVAQQPLGLNCFGLFEFTQDRFYELLNMAYSMYTFFRDFV